MKKSNLIRHGRHCVFKLHVHLVFVTKYRKNIFTKSLVNEFKEIFGKICLDFESTLIEIDGEQDHIHLLIEYPPKISISKLVNSLKGVSSRLIKKRHQGLQKNTFKGSLWSPSYFAASCGGASLKIIKEYIENHKIGF